MANCLQICFLILAIALSTHTHAWPWDDLFTPSFDATSSDNAYFSCFEKNLKTGEILVSSDRDLVVNTKTSTVRTGWVTAAYNERFLSDNLIAHTTWFHSYTSIAAHSKYRWNGDSLLKKKWYRWHLTPKKEQENPLIENMGESAEPMYSYELDLANLELHWKGYYRQKKSWTCSPLDGYADYINHLSQARETELKAQKERQIRYNKEVAKKERQELQKSSKAPIQFHKDMLFLHANSNASGMKFVVIDKPEEEVITFSLWTGGFAYQINYYTMWEDEDCIYFRSMSGVDGGFVGPINSIDRTTLNIKISKDNHVNEYCEAKHPLVRPAQNQGWKLVDLTTFQKLRQVELDRHIDNQSRNKRQKEQESQKKLDARKL